MKIKLSLLFLLSLQSAGFLFGQKQKITLTAIDQPIKTVFDQIGSKTEYYILYSDEVVPDSLRVTVRADRRPVSEVLSAILPPHGLAYSLTQKGLIVISALPGRTGANRTPGRQQLVLKGGVYDTKNLPLAFASVGLFSENLQLTASITDEKGAFTLSYPFKDSESYTIRISSLGYKPENRNFIFPDTAFCSHIVLSGAPNSLNTVTVTARKPLILRKADRYVINVEDSYLADEESGLDVLKKSPGIWVDNNDGIRIKGNQPVMVMINDVVQRMSQADLAEYLRTLRSETISRIEVIPNPPSEFEASGTGGIIHIILKKARKDGLIASANARYRQQVEKPAAGGGLSFDYKSGNFYLFGNAAYSKEKSYYLATTDIVYPDKSLYYSTTDRNNDNERNQYRLGMAYDLSPAQSIGLQTIHSGSYLVQSFVTGIDLLSAAAPIAGASNSGWVRKPRTNSSTLNYSWKIDTLGSSLKFIADYTNSTKSETNNFTADYNDPSRDSQFRNNTPNTTDIFSVQTDYTKAFKNASLVRGGLKFVSTKRDNETLREDYTGGDWILNTGGSNHFIYRESLLMGYISAEGKFKNTTLKAGLRGEETFVNGNSVTLDKRFSRDYFGLFPSLFVTQTLNEKKGNSINASYARRLQRPGFTELNPYRLQFDTYMVKTGNPDLTPQYSNNVQLNFDFLHDYSAGAYYTRTSDVIGELANPIGNNIIEYQTVNLNRSTEYGLTFFAPVRITKWWATNNDFSVYHLTYVINDFKNANTSFSAKITHTLTLKGNTEVSLYSEYDSPYSRSNSRIAWIYFLDIGISKKIIEKKARVSFFVSDVFNTFRDADVTTYNNTRIDFYQKRPTRTFSLNFSYSISTGKKFSNKKIDESNKEEKNRIGN